METLGLGFDGSGRFVLLEFAEDFLGSSEDGAGDAGHSGDVDSVGAIGAAGEDSVGPDNVVTELFDADAEVLDGWDGFCDGVELVVVGGKEGFATGFDKVLNHRPGDGEAVVG